MYPEPCQLPSTLKGLCHAACYSFPYRVIEEGLPLRRNGSRAYVDRCLSKTWFKFLIPRAVVRLLFDARIEDCNSRLPGSSIIIGSSILRQFHCQEAPRVSQASTRMYVPDTNIYVLLHGCCPCIQLHRSYFYRSTGRLVIQGLHLLYYWE